MSNQKKFYALQRNDGPLLRITEFWDLSNALKDFDGILIDDDKDNLLSIAVEMISGYKKLKVVEVSIKTKQCKNIVWPQTTY